MAQRRNSSGRDDQNDLDDLKALAAKARETGGPVLKANPAELSGVRPRRDSVIGMRLTPPPRATSGDLPNWFWGALGCLSVLLVGFAALFVLGRSGKLGPLLGDAASLVTPAPASTSAPVAPAPPEPTEPTAAAKQPEAPARVDHAAGVEHAPAAEHVAHEHAARPAPADEPAGAPSPVAAAEAPAAPTDDPAPTAPADDTTAAKRPARAAGSKIKTKEGEAAAPAADDDSAGGDTPAAKTRAAAAAATKAAADDPDDDQSLPGQDDVERALDALAPRVRGCFVKYQIKGTARVRLVATPAGKAESVNVTGDFEDTPTGLCVESVLGEAKLPTFKGPPLKLSQSYQLR